MSSFSHLVKSREILHVTPVLPVDEHHIEYALDRLHAAGELVTSWIASPLEHAWMRNLRSYRQGVRREPLRLHFRSVCRSFLPDLRRSFELWAKKYETILHPHDRWFDAIDRRAARRLSPSTDMVVGREFGCLHSFRKAAQHGAKRLYHLPTVHHETLRTVLAEEQRQWPGVCTSTFDPGEFDSTRLARKEEELALATCIICPSEFVAQSLSKTGHHVEKTTVLPFGSETAWLEHERRSDGKTFLFVGNISARKGAHRLLVAWKRLKAYRTHRLLMVGDMHLSPSFLKDHQGMFEHRPKVSRECLRDLYLSADAMVLPALAEGFALVILEALSCGTAVLASLNSGAAGFLQDGTEARLFAAQNDDALLDTLDWALANPAARLALGAAGRKRAVNWQWKQFEDELVRFILSEFEK